MMTQEFRQRGPDPELQREADNADYSLRQEQHAWKMEEIRVNQEHAKALAEMEKSKDIKIAQLQASISKSRYTSREKQITRRVYARALVRLPVLPFIALFSFLLRLCRLEVPESFERFIES
jgi:hypothetical protein